MGFRVLTASGALKQGTVPTLDLAQASGTLGVGNGGTGATTLTGILKGSGASAITAIAIPGTTTTFLDGTGAFVDPWVFRGVLGSPISTGANTTPVDVTGLVFTFAANANYVIELFAIMQSAAATTGYGLQFDVSAAVTAQSFTFFHQLANTGTLSGGSSIADDASVGVSSGIPSGNTDLPLYGSGVLVTGANTGTAQLRLRSETTAVCSIRAGSMMRVMRIS